MSFLDDIVDVGSSALGYLGGSGIGSQLARAAITGYALNQLNKSINGAADQQVDPGVRQQVAASSENSIPVVYGQAWLGGIITDAQLTNNNGTMYYCLTLCEKTGNTNLGAGAASTFTFGEVYRDDMRLVFADDGVTVLSAVDRDGNICSKPDGKIQVFCFDGSSENPVSLENYSSTGLQMAYDIFPDWTASHMMTGLVFAIVKVDYSAEKDIKGLGNIKFKLTNSMSMPGDCLYDYMTNTVYGAGIPAGSIYLS